MELLLNTDESDELMQAYHTVREHVAQSDAQLLSIQSLAVQITPLPPDMLVDLVADTFHRSPEIDAFPLIEDMQPVGLITRRKLSMSLFTRFGHALYGRKPISRLAQSHPIIVRIDDRLVSVINRALDRPQEDVYDDLIVVDRFGKYYGILSVKQLVLRQTDMLVNTLDQRALAQKQAQELERINTMKSQFISCITHELRAPVNTMIGLAELIQFAQNSGDLNKVGNYASLSLTAATNLRALVNNILDLAKIEAGRLEVQIDTFNLSRVVIEVKEATEILLRNKDVRTVNQCPSQDIYIQSDSIKVRQILTNIANNAAKFTEHGHIVFKIEFRADQVILSIADTGVGIKKEDQSELFKAFSQVGDIKTRSHEGTGLGLVITKYLVELLHGKLYFESEFGVGTTFIVIFPCKPQFKEREINHA